MYFVYIFAQKYLYMLVHCIGIKTFAECISTLLRMFILGR